MKQKPFRLDHGGRSSRVFPTTQDSSGKLLSRGVLKSVRNDLFNVVTVRFRIKILSEGLS